MSAAGSYTISLRVNNGVVITKTVQVVFPSVRFRRPNHNSLDVCVGSDQSVEIEYVNIFNFLGTNTRQTVQQTIRNQAGTTLTSINSLQLITEYNKRFTIINASLDTVCILPNDTIRFNPICCDTNRVVNGDFCNTADPAGYNFTTAAAQSAVISINQVKYFSSNTFDFGIDDIILRRVQPTCQTTFICTASTTLQSTLPTANVTNYIWRSPTGVLLQQGAALTALTYSNIPIGQSVITLEAVKSCGTSLFQQFRVERATTLSPSITQMGCNPNVSLYPDNTPLWFAGDFGMFISNVMTPITIGGFSARNRFDNLKTGIYTNLGSNITVRNTIFSNIKPTNTLPSNAFPQIPAAVGTGLYVNGKGTSNAWIQVRGIGKLNPTATFNECNRGIYINGTTCVIEACKMTNVLTGITAEMAVNKTIVIGNSTASSSGNAINASKVGIDLLYNAAPASQIYVLNNTVSLTNNSIKPTAAIRLTDNVSSAFQNCLLENNNISLNGTAAYALSLSGVKGAILHNNNIVLNSASNRVGIFATNCQNTNMECNDIEGADIATGSATAVLLQEAINNTLTCNTTNNTPTGVSILNNCNNSTLKGTHIGVHNIGLLYNANAQLGQQTANNGNKWNAPTYPIAGIRHEGTDPNWIFANSQLQINPNAAPYRPAYNQTAWFPNCPPANQATLFGSNPNLPSPFDCTTVANCAATLAPSTGGGGGALLLDESENALSLTDSLIAIGEYEPPTFTEEQIWKDSRYLYAKLLENPDLVNEKPELEAFQDTINLTTAIPAFEAIAREMPNLSKLSSTLSAQINTIKLQTTVYYDAMIGLDTLIQAATDDSIVQLYKAQSNAIIAQLKVLDEEYQLLVAQADNEKTDKNESAKIQNAGLPTNTVFTANEKMANAVYLQTIAKGVFSFEPNDLATLQIIAQQCPLAGGNAVYAARAMLAAVDADDFYNDKNLCASVGISMRQKPKVSDKQTTNIKIYPNPSTGLVNFDLGRSDYEKVTITITDIVGKQIYSITEYKNQYTKFDLTALYSGLYYAKITFDESDVKVLPFSIIK